MDKNLLFGGLISPLIWGDPPNMNSFLYKGFPFKGRSSIAVMLHYLERTLFGDTELPDDSRAFDRNPISFLVLVANSLLHLGIGAAPRRHQSRLADFKIMPRHGPN